MNITRGGLGCLVLLLGWMVCGMLATVGVIVLLFGSRAWGVGYIVMGAAIAAAASIGAHLLSRENPASK